MILQIVQRVGIPFILLFMAFMYFMEVRGHKAQDLMLIKPVFYMMVVLFFINTATDLRDIVRNRDKEAAAETGERRSLKTILSFAGLAVLLVAALPYVGFLISSTVFIFLALSMFKVNKKEILYLMPICVSVILWALFEHGFGVELPVGLLGF